MQSTVRFRFAPTDRIENESCAEKVQRLRLLQADIKIHIERLLEHASLTSIELTAYHSAFNDMHQWVGILAAHRLHRQFRLGSTSELQIRQGGAKTLERFEDLAKAERDEVVARRERTVRRRQEVKENKRRVEDMPAEILEQARMELNKPKQLSAAARLRAILNKQIKRKKDSVASSSMDETIICFVRVGSRS